MIVILFLNLFIFFNFQSSPILTTQAASGSFSEDFTTTTYMDGANSNATGWGSGEVEISKKKPTVIGSIGSALIGNILDVFIDGDYAYVTDVLTGLRVVDISNPANPYPIGSYETSGVAYSVLIAGDCAYIADYDGDPFLHKNFLVLNVTDPTSPSLLGNCSTYLGVNYLAHGLAIDGNLVYVANMGGGLSVIDVTDSSTPTLIGMRNTPGTSFDVSVDGDLAYVADGTNGLVIVNITNPSNPQIVATFNTNIGSVDNVVIEGNYAYLLDTDNGLIVVDITDPTVPYLAGELNENYLSDADIYGDFLYATDLYDGLLIANISIPTDPFFISLFSTPGLAQAISIEGCNAYIACLNGGFQVVKISDTISPIAVSSIDITAFEIKIIGDFAYLAALDEGLQVINVSDPAAPMVVGTYDIEGHDEARSVAISGDFAYLAYGAIGMHIVNISDPNSPSYVGSYDTPGYAKSVFIDGNYAYLGVENEGLLILDVSDHSSPILIGSYILGEVQEEVYDIFVSGKFAYITCYGSYGFRILDISNPYSPTLVGSLSISSTASGFDIAGDYAYIAMSGRPGFISVDISDPTNPIEAGGFSTYTGAEDVFISGDYAYVAYGVRDFQILNITDPTTPTLIVRYDLSAGPNSVFVSGDHVYTGHFFILKVRNNRFNQYENSCVAKSTVILSSSSSYSFNNSVLIVSDFITSDTTIDYFLSADNGLNWEPISPGIIHKFVNIGNQLMWRSIMSTSSDSKTPTIYNLSINYTTSLNSPNLLNPLDGHITDDYTPTFTWSGVNGETNYLFQLDNTTSFTEPLLNVTLSSSSTSYDVSSALAPDTYYWRVAGIDSENDIGVYSNYRTIYIIDDTNAPTIDSPTDVTYEVGEIGNSITWNPSDTNPYFYNITRNTTLLEQGISWDGGSITIDVDGLTEGVYNFTCYVYDQAGLYTFDSVIVTVEIPVIGEFTYYSIFSLMFITATLIIIYSKKKRIIKKRH